MNIRIVALVGIGAIIFAACATPNSPTPTPTAVEIAAATATALPQATSTSLPTATATSTSTPTFTATSTPMAKATATLEPTATSTPAPTTAPRNTATPKPTAVPPTATTAALNVEVPPPQVFQFDVGGFMQYLEFAHEKYQRMLEYVGGAIKGDYVGSCNMFIMKRDELMAIAAFTDVPEQWKAMVDEYHSLRTQAFVATDPIHQLCKGRGGTISEETARTFTSLLDRAQNRMYEMLQQAQAMTQ